MERAVSSAGGVDTVEVEETSGVSDEMDEMQFSGTSLLTCHDLNSSEFRPFSRNDLHPPVFPVLRV
jgi:hypothetical protein